MNFIRKLWARLTCRHVFVWQRNYHGDVIHYAGGKRSLWCCEKCGKFTERDELGQPGARL